LGGSSVHAGAGGVALFEDFRRQIAQGGVQPLSVIDLFNEVLDGGARFLLVAVLAQINLFGL
jgi:hypothetical protein